MPYSRYIACLFASNFFTIPKLWIKYDEWIVQSVWPAVSRIQRRAEAGALDGQKNADVGERRPLRLVAAPTLSHQVVELSRTVGNAGGGDRTRRVSGNLVAVPLTQGGDELRVCEPVVRPAWRRRHHLPHGHSERPHVALRRKPLLNGDVTQKNMIDWLGFNGNFSTNRLYHASDKYLAVKKSEINEKVDNVTCWEYIQ